MLGRVLKTKNERLVHAINNNDEPQSELLNLLGATVPQDQQEPFVEPLVQAIRDHDYETAYRYLNFGILIPKDQATQYADEFIEASEARDDKQSNFWAAAGVSLADPNEQVRNALLNALHFSHCAKDQKKVIPNKLPLGHNHKKSLESVRLLIKLGARIDANKPEAAYFSILLHLKATKRLFWNLLMPVSTLTGPTPKAIPHCILQPTWDIQASFNLYCNTKL